MHALPDVDIDIKDWPYKTYKLQKVEMHQNWSIKEVDKTGTHIHGSHNIAMLTIEGSFDFQSKFVAPFTKLAPRSSGSSQPPEGGRITYLKLYLPKRIFMC